MMRTLNSLKRAWAGKTLINITSHYSLAQTP